MAAVHEANANLGLFHGTPNRLILKVEADDHKRGTPTFQTTSLAHWRRVRSGDAPQPSPLRRRGQNNHVCRLPLRGD